MEDQHMKKYIVDGKAVWRYSPPPGSAEALQKQFDEVPEQQRAAFLKTHESLLPAENPERQPGEGRAGYVLRCQEEKHNRATVLKQRVVRDYQESLKPTPGQKLIAAMNEDAKANLEKKRVEDAAAGEIAVESFPLRRVQVAFGLLETAYSP